MSTACSAVSVPLSLVSPGCSLHRTVSCRGVAESHFEHSGFLAGDSFANRPSSGQGHASTLAARQREGTIGSPLQAVLPHCTVSEDEEVKKCPQKSSAIVQGGGIDGIEVNECTSKKPGVRNPETSCRGKVVRGPSLGELEALSEAVRSWGIGKQRQSSSTELRGPCTALGSDRRAETACQERHVGCEHNISFSCTAPAPLPLLSPRPPPHLPSPPLPKRCVNSSNACRTAPNRVVHFKALPFRLDSGCDTVHRALTKLQPHPPLPSRSPVSLPLDPATDAQVPVHLPGSTPLLRLDTTAHNNPCDSKVRSARYGASLDPDELHQHIKKLSSLSMRSEESADMVCSWMLDVAPSVPNLHSYEPS